ncbi:MAG: sporulation protein Cse60 [Bacilli bacterium]|nr:sporulation protein Cse60 [Bacilli bacterium]MDD4734041.1 sporulation protein Cse60 [Bacilli bacterium]
MNVKIFDENDEKDLENKINLFFKENDVELIDIKYQVAMAMFAEDQIYCFSAMIIYTK